MTWRYGDWSATHGLPLGAGQRAAVGQKVRAGDVIAAGTTFGSPIRLAGARRLGVTPGDLARVLRVSEGAEIERGTIIARTGRRFARSVTAPFAGRIAHVRADGDIELAPIVGRWTVLATLDGRVTRSSPASVTVEGVAWGLQGLAAYGPDAIGDLAMAVDGPTDDLHPSRIDTRQQGRILVGGGRSGAEAIARAHACGVSAVIAGAVPAGGLRVVFGDDVTAQGASLRADAPTVLCLLGFGATQLPPQIFAPLRSLAGTRAAVHTATARLFVFAPRDALQTGGPPPTLALLADWGAVRVLDGPATLAGDTVFPSEYIVSAVGTPEGPVPAANVLTAEARRGA